VIADMKDSLDRVMGFLNAANLDIEDHYAIFQDVINAEAKLAYETPATASERRSTGKSPRRPATVRDSTVRRLSNR
jgi:hypothetical protein